MLHGVGQKGYSVDSTAYTAPADLIRPVTPSTDAAHEAFLRMMPSDVVAHVWTDTHVPALAGVEASGVERAVPSRRDEFARGRGCARRVLAALGHADTPVPVGPDRAPVWPEGVVGSITHTDGFVAAAGADARAVAALGVDVEHIRPLEADVTALVLTPEDAKRRDRPEWDVLAFSAKESVHKSVHPATGVWLDFLDVSIVPVDEDGFRVEAETDLARSVGMLDDLHGVYRVVPPFAMTLVYTRP